MNFIIRWQAASDERFDFEIHVRNFAYYIYMYPGLRKAVQDQAKISKYRAAAFAERSTDPPLIEMALQYVKVLDDAAPDIPITKTYIIW
ncbi:hypothetical protein GWN42_20765 [candidate division KSB1 bacterium]|nr:hypothetical protein [Phycisphaerae bacterium]NIU10621.1 hypothetical protein [Phycisphaerae bacterium]NIV95153.1 hypothetical protein [candidate division KSB1 bacterium]